MFKQPSSMTRLIIIIYFIELEQLGLVHKCLSLCSSTAFDREYFCLKLPDFVEFHHIIFPQGSVTTVQNVREMDKVIDSISAFQKSIPFFIVKPRTSTCQLAQLI